MDLKVEVTSKAYLAKHTILKKYQPQKYDELCKVDCLSKLQIMLASSDRTWWCGGGMYFRGPNKHTDYAF